MPVNRATVVNRMSLWVHSVVMLGLAMLIVSLITGHVVRKDEQRHLESTLEEQTGRIISMLSAVSVDAIISSDVPVLKTIVEAVALKYASMVTLEISNASGKPIHQWEREGDQPADLRLYSEPVVFEGEVYGEIKIQLDAEDALRRVDQKVGNMRLISLGSLILLGATALALVYVFILRPVEHIYQGLSEQRTGNHRSHVQLSGMAAKELVRLGDSVNALGAARQELTASHEKLEEYNRNLAREVEQRTAELAASMKDAEEANEAKSSFLAKMSHELRTPLNAIIGYSEMLQEEAEDIEESDLFIPDLQKIHGAGKHLLGLINDILDLSKVESGRMDLYLEEFSVKAMVDEVAATVHPLVEKNGNTLVVDYPELDETMRSDVTKLRQNLFNLLSNASKFTQQGEIGMRVTTSEKPDGRWIQFEITDSGIGMTEEQVEVIFEPFSQADASTTRNYGGTGLGLAITKKFCDLLGGAIEVESEAGKGSTFRMQLPLSAEDLAGTEPVAEGAPEVSPAVSTASRILVIDDDPTVHDLMRRFLSKEGYEVHVASSGDEGMRLAREIKPDTITLDVMMPGGMDGWAVLSALKSDKELAAIPVIMLTIVDNRNLGFALGASEYIPKPIDRDLLTSALRRCQGSPGPQQVLIVEDDSATRGLLRRSIEKKGWEVLEAENGIDAISLLEKNSPTLILLDLIMPEMNGFEFLAELRARAESRTIPVIVLTSKDLTSDEKGRLNGCVKKVVLKGSQDHSAVLADLSRLLAQWNTRGDQAAGEVS